MKRYPIYGTDGFCIEYLNLLRQPRTLNEVDRQLACLSELERNGPYGNWFNPRPYSKRRQRLVKMYWILRKSA